MLNLWQEIEDEYFLRHTSDEIAWQTQGMIRHKDKDTPLVLVNKKTSRGNSLVFVHMPNSKNIFSTATRVIEKLGLNIVDARIITNENGYTLDTFAVLESDNKRIKNEERCNEVKARVKKALTSTEEKSEPTSWIENRQIKNFNLPNLVKFDTDKKNNRTIMEVNTIDRPGVLSRISTAMALCGINLQGAKIATYGERVEDIFYLVDDENNAIDDPLKFECLENSVLEALS